MDINKHPPLATHQKSSKSRPLIVSFAFQNWSDNKTDYLKSEVTKLNELFECQYHTIFVHDESNSWYTNGFDGSENLADSAQYIIDSYNQLEATSLHFVGESMGAFGALLLASLINQQQEVNSILLFSPISFFSSVRCEQYGDYRFINSSKSAHQIMPTANNDVAYMAPINHTRISIIYGGKANINHLEATTFDALHAWRIKHYFSQTQIHTSAELNIHTKQQLQIIDVLYQHINNQLLNDETLHNVTLSHQ